MDLAQEQDVTGASPHPSHYRDNVKQLTELGDQQTVVAREDIYSDSGAKLLAKGAAINSDRQVLLLKHKLNKPLDLVVEITDGITTELLLAHAEVLLQTPVAKGGLQGLCWGAQALGALGRFQLRTVAANKLTLAHCNWSNLFEHSVRMALFAGALAHQLQITPEREQLLVGAGLLHDLGMLHLDPELANEKDYHVALAPEQLQRLQAHPGLGGFLAGLDGYPSDLVRWIESHHERTDGSGYPHRNKGLSLEAQLLALAEILVGQFERGLLPRAVVTLKSFAERQFSSVLCYSALAVIDSLAAASALQPNLDQSSAGLMAKDLQALQNLLQQGQELLAAEPKLATTFGQLLADFARTGISSPMVPELLQTTEGDELLNETQALLGEYLYRLRRFAQEQAGHLCADGQEQWRQQVMDLSERYL